MGDITFIHLAARVSVPACEADPAGAYASNVVLARATAETVLRWSSARGLTARVIYVSTGHVYAALADGARTSEGAPVKPRSVYAQTKLAGEQAISDAASGWQAPVLAARVFGLIAPQQAPNYVLPGLIERAAAGRLDAIPGLDSVRDYLDARDVCEDLVLLASAAWPDWPSVVNICSGEPTSIRELLVAVLQQLEPAQADELARRATAAPGRPDDVRWLVGHPTRFTALTGKPTKRIPLAATIADAVAARGGAASMEVGGTGGTQADLSLAAGGPG